MFVQHQVEVELPISSLEKVIIERLASLEDMGEVVYRNGEGLRSKVGPKRPLAKEVVLKLGQPRISHSGIAIPVTWRATAAQTLFPRLSGELEASKITSSRSVLRLRASYDAPFGWLGDVVDHLLLERVAHLTVVDWLERVARSIEDSET